MTAATEKKDKLPRVKTLDNLEQKKRKLITLGDNAWGKHIGRTVEPRGSWLVWGNSGNGKTAYLVQMAGFLSQFGKTWFVPLEEGDSESLRQTFGRSDVYCRANIGLIDDDIDTMFRRLEKRNSADYIVLDSVQYAGFSYKEYKAILKLFPGKQFVMSSHAEGKMPRGKVAQAIMYDAFVKVWVEGYMADAKSRYAGGEILEPYIIWQEGYARYWNIE